MEFIIPQPLKTEHNELHEMLKSVTQLPGKTGEEAKNVANLLHPHFINEEEYALPPLGLLPLLAEGKFSKEMEGVLELTEKLKSNLPQMLSEHQQIVEALKVLIKAAKDENHPEVADFAGKLMRHAQTEEEVTYPTSILIGEFVKLKLGKAD